MSEHHDSQTTAIGGRFIAAFAVLGLAVAFALTTWSIRSAGTEAGSQNDAAETTTTNVTTSQKQQDSTHTSRPSGVRDEVSEENTERPSRSTELASPEDPYLPPHAWNKPNTGSQYDQDAQPTSIWLAEPGKAPERRSANSGTSNSNSQNGAGSPQTASPATPSAPAATQTPDNAGQPTQTQTPSNGWEDLTSYLPKIPEISKLKQQPEQESKQELVNSNEAPRPTKTPANNNGGASTNKADNNAGNGQAGSTREPVAPNSQGNAGNTKEIVPDSGTFNN